MMLLLTGKFTSLSQGQGELRALVIEDSTVEKKSRSESKKRDTAVQLRDGFVEVTNAKIVNADDEFLSMRYDIKRINNDNKRKYGEQTVLIPENQKPIAVIGLRMNGLGDGIYLVYENTVAGIFKNANGTYMKASRAADNSRIFAYAGALFVAPSGAIVASTTTTLLIITPTYIKSATYKDMFGVEGNLQRPYIAAGNAPDLAELRDVTIKDDKGAIRLVINLTKFQVDGIPASGKQK